MRITHFDISAIGDGPGVDPDKGGVEPLAIIQVRTDEGLTGLSECFRVPPGVVRAAVGGPDTHFGSLLLGQQLTHPERLWQLMWDALLHTNRRGWEIMILGALDVAIWDLYGQMLGQPVWKLLGGAQRGPFQSPAGTLPVQVTPYCTIVSDVWGGEAMFTQQVARAVKLAELGYRAVKVEPMFSTPADVVEMARRARAALGPDFPLMVDVGYLFNDVPTGVRVARALEELNVEFFETPFPVDHPEPYARLAAQTACAAGDGGARGHALGVARHDGPRRRQRGAALHDDLRRTDRSPAHRVTGARTRGTGLSGQLVDADSRRGQRASGGVVADHAVHRVRGSGGV
jgi:L-alanine-DL-glutamate epimerase-like enolase superfamily enzyme